MKQPHDIPQRVLVIRFSALGDVAMTLPVIYSVARSYPATTFLMVTRPFFAKLFVNRPANVEVHAVDLAADYHGFRGLRRLVSELAALRPDAVADLHNMSRSWVIDNYFRLKNIPVAMVDKQRRQRRAMLSHGVEQESFINRYFDVFARLGLPAEPQFSSLYKRGEWADAPVVVKHPAIGIAPFARYFNKTYPLDMMSQAIGLLIGKGYHVYLFGAPGAETEALQKIAPEYGEMCECIAGRYDLTEEMAIIARMDVMVCMDSANQHIAALTGTPVLTIWGGTTPACGFAAFGSEPGNAIVANLDCQPCCVAGAPTCPRSTLACMMQIEPPMLAERVERFCTQHAK